MCLSSHARLQGVGLQALVPQEPELAKVLMEHAEQVQVTRCEGV